MGERKEEVGGWFGGWVGGRRTVEEGVDHLAAFLEVDQEVFWEGEEELRDVRDDQDLLGWVGGWVG